MGNKFAQYNFGNSLYHGDGVAADMGGAVYWLSESCANGYEKACNDVQYIKSKNLKKTKPQINTDKILDDLVKK